MSICKKRVIDTIPPKLSEKKHIKLPTESIEYIAVTLGYKYAQMLIDLEKNKSMRNKP